VTIVVPVLITSCHVLEKPNAGPLEAQTRTTSSASKNAGGEPTTPDVK
jgi:hypothetical protein